MSVWPKVTDKGDHVMISDPPRGIGLSIEKKSRNGYFFCMLMLQCADTNRPKLGEPPYEFWLGAN